MHCLLKVKFVCLFFGKVSLVSEGTHVQSDEIVNHTNKLRFTKTLGLTPLQVVLLKCLVREQVSPSQVKGDFRK